MTDIGFTNEFKRCGEILIAVECNKTSYAFNCLLCGDLSLKLESFCAHITEHHADRYPFKIIDEIEISNINLESDSDKIEEENEHKIVNETNDDPLDGFLDSLSDITTFSDLESVGNKSEIEQFDERIEESIELEYEPLKVDSAEHFNTLDIEDDTKVYEKTSIDEESEIENELTDVCRSNRMSSLPLPNLTHKQTLQMIKLYKSFPCLWDVRDVGYRFKNQQKKALDEMLKAVNDTMQLSTTEKKLNRIIYRITFACTHEKHRRLQCEEKNQQYKPKCIYYKHVQFLENHVDPFKCEYCNQVFHNYNPYIMHKSQHDGSMPFVCKVCNRGFALLGNYDVHLRRHTKDFLFNCKVCGKGFVSSTEMATHEIRHTNSKPYCCEICGLSFRVRNKLNVHQQRHFNNPSHICTICSKGFYTSTAFNEHMRRHRNIRDRLCNVCGKGFTTWKSLSQHKNIHAEKKRWNCKICGKAFAQQPGLRYHMKSHGLSLSSTVSELKMLTDTSE